MLLFHHLVTLTGALHLTRQIYTHIHAQLRSQHACLTHLGDNPFTAVSIARECGILSAQSRVYLSEVDGRITWHDASDPSLTIDDAAILAAAEATVDRPPYDFFHAIR